MREKWKLVYFSQQYPLGIKTWDANACEKLSYFILRAEFCNTTCEWILSSFLQSSCKVWQRTSRRAQWLTQSWFQGKGRKNLRSWRWSHTRSSLGIAQTLLNINEPNCFKKRTHQRLLSRQRKDWQRQYPSQMRCTLSHPKQHFVIWSIITSIIYHLFLNTGGKDLIRGHGLKGVFVPQGTLQATYVIGYTAHRSIGCFHCGFQLQSSRWGVKATKRTQVEVAWVTLPEK